ncbi:MAG: DUF177 domain-containing protein [Candidatus Hydrothermae bacterium]|nr:DUF177 domain-containing protein [Candidatus Hydrothermae bacterium]
MDELTHPALRLRFSDLRPGDNRFTLELTGEELDLPQRDDLAFPHTVYIVIDAHKETTTVTVRVTTRTTVRLQCSRCLETFTREVRGEETYVIRRGRERLAREQALREEDIHTLFTVEDEVDLTPLVREPLLLEIPVRPLCREDCRGLCPVCGVNRNVEDCGHRPETPQAGPLAALKQLVQKPQKESDA